MDDIKKYMKILNESYIDSFEVSEDHHTNADMLKKVLLQLKNNVLELENFVESVSEIEPWVLSKMAESNQTIESVYNYIKSEVVNQQITEPTLNAYGTEYMGEAHPNSKIYDKCWDGYKKVPGKKRGEPGSCEKNKKD